MTIRTKQLLALCALTALLLAACGGSGGNTANTTANGGGTAAQTGVASCDEYLARVEKCVNNPGVPETVKATYRNSLQLNRDTWKKAAADPTAKAQLETTCKQALDAVKSTLDQFCK